MMNDLTMPPIDTSDVPWTLVDAGYGAGLVMLTVVIFLAVIKFRNEYYERHGHDWRDDLW
ncbi:hypothetical protein [Mesorhizobium sp.]|uniref:hypothetical protein n=1 Tax=Mesorhizobium sp. TaxID=1871066 RepID=UPI000FE52872|nr:hypothetical protein [Mesorhizobium sp.]RWC28803.1 MAG: hypothetical protein EOS27_17835 [Mesorhizobium sp.]TIX28286.1 MAG: hypothetical protein E5V35_02810 [Mesorhizobium sp.]